MAEYIELDSALRVTHIMRPEDEDLKSAISNIPAADVAPVVRCEDCVHWDDDPDTYGSDCGPKGKCMKSFETMCADDFCSYGERKDSDNAT